jgi:Septum formation
VPLADRRRAGVVLCAVALLLSACSGDDAGDEDTLGAEPFQLDLEVGQCFDRPADPDVGSVPAVPCRRPHDLQVIAVFDLEDADRYPGPGVVAERAGNGCNDRFEDFVGVPQDSSGLLLVPYAPDQLAWDAGVRQVTCAVSLSEGRLEGSVEGSEGQGE